MKEPGSTLELAHTQLWVSLKDRGSPVGWGKLKSGAGGFRLSSASEYRKYHQKWPVDVSLWRFLQAVFYACLQNEC